MLAKWLDKWLEIGHECKQTGWDVPIRSYIAWFLVYKLKVGN